MLQKLVLSQMTFVCDIVYDVPLRVVCWLVRFYCPTRPDSLECPRVGVCVKAI